MKSPRTIDRERRRLAHLALSGDDAPLTYGGVYLYGALSALSWVFGASPVDKELATRSMRRWPITQPRTRKSKPRRIVGHA